MQNDSQLNAWWDRVMKWCADRSLNSSSSRSFMAKSQEEAMAVYALTSLHEQRTPDAHMAVSVASSNINHTDRSNKKSNNTNDINEREGKYFPRKLLLDDFKKDKIKIKNSDGQVDACLSDSDSADRFSTNSVSTELRGSIVVYDEHEDTEMIIDDDDNEESLQYTQIENSLSSKADHSQSSQNEFEIETEQSILDYGFNKLTSLFALPDSTNSNNQRQRLLRLPRGRSFAEVQRVSRRWKCSYEDAIEMMEDFEIANHSPLTDRQREAVWVGGQYI